MEKLYIIVRNESTTKCLTGRMPFSIPIIAIKQRRICHFDERKGLFLKCSHEREEKSLCPSMNCHIEKLSPGFLDPF
jgi:hypothetical protein